MAGVIRNRIVTDGLIFYQDAGNIQSYPGTGTKWYDLISNLEGDILNGASYNSESFGGIEFDGIDDKVEIPEINLSGDFTISQTINVTNKSNGNMPIGGGNKDGGSTYKGYAWFREGANTVYLRVNGETGGTFSVDSSYWQDKTITYSWKRENDVYYLYIEDELVAGSTLLSTNDFTIRSIGWSYNTSYHSEGSIYRTLIYDRALTEEEVIHNFDTIKYRYAYE